MPYSQVIGKETSSRNNNYIYEVKWRVKLNEVSGEFKKYIFRFFQVLFYVVKIIEQLAVGTNKINKEHLDSD